MYKPNPKRYDKMIYNRVGNSGLKLPQISLGMWQNFGNEKPYDEIKEIVLAAFDAGITHFDLANNYGRPFGSAESNLGKIIKEDLAPYRDEIVVSTKAGYTMWDGPYGDHGSRKYIFASINQSLNRLGLEYVDIFYHHRPDYDTPLEETMKALADIISQGKALYIGLSNYPADRALKAKKLLEEYGVRLLIHQPKYSMFEQWIINEDLRDVMVAEGVGIIPFSTLAQGMLTDKYLNEIPRDSRAGNSEVPFLHSSNITQDVLGKVRSLNEIAKKRNQSLAQMAMAWVCATKGVTSILMGVSRLSQLQENIKTLNNLDFSEEELLEIESIIK